VSRKTDLPFAFLDFLTRPTGAQTVSAAEDVRQFDLRQMQRQGEACRSTESDGGSSGGRSTRHRGR
jgi:hypothetical protein